jgi:hypothetical protein
MFNHPLRNAVFFFSVGLLATSSFAFGQNSASVQSNTTKNQQQTATTSSGGWKRVGDGQNGDPSNNQPAYPADQAPTNGAYPSDTGQNPPPPAPSAGNPSYGQQPPPYQPQQQPGPYTQQPPYGAYGQQGQQQNYPPPPPIPATLTIPQGAYITVRVNQYLSSDRNQPGDAFSATLVNPVVVNGIVVAEPGQTVGGRVSLVEKHSTSRPARLGVQLTNLPLVDGQQLSINTQLTSRRGGTTPGAVEAGTVATTTGLGAAIGAAAGWGTGAAIGAGAGALAGLIGVVVTHNHPSVIAPEQVLTFQLQLPVTFSTSASQAAFRYVQPGEYSQPYQNAPGPGPYAVAAPPAPYPYYGYPYPYYAYAYPYYWGPSFAFFYGRGWYGGRYYYHPGGFRGGVIVHGRR